MDFSIFVRSNSIFPLVAKLDIAADSDSEGRGFESLRAGQQINHPKAVVDLFLLRLQSLIEGIVSA